MKKNLGGAAVLAALVMSCSALGSDHKEAPLIRQDLTADVNDVYAFLNPNDSSRLVLAMTVNPFSAPTESTTFRFSPDVRYTFAIDTNNDGVPQMNIRVNFSEIVGGVQTFDVNFPGTANDFSGTVTMPTLLAAANPAVVTNGPNGIDAFAGPRDDPFFFDVVGFNRFLLGAGSFSGADGFAGFNTSAIVIEMPLSLLPNNATSFQVSATTERRRVTLRRAEVGNLEVSVGPWQQIDRVGNPGVATAFIPTGRKDLYNIGTPDNDAADFAGDIIASLTALGTDATNIGILAGVALPDTLKVDTTVPIGYPNGRNLDDDVIDTLLFFIFNQTPVSDGANANDLAFSNTFPYLAGPHQAP